MVALLSVLAAAAFGLLSYRMRFLSRSGAVAAALLAVSLLTLGGPAWIAPALTFFVLSSLLSKIGSARKKRAQRMHEKGSVRDAGQVLANGGVAWLLLLVHAAWPSDVLYGGYLGAFAAAAADTWATEIGMLFGGTPRLVLTGRRVPRGTSGAVSAAGMTGALLGAAAVVLSAWPLAGGSMGPSGLTAVLLGGVAASLVDSLAGATIQVRYRDPETGQETEHPGPEKKPYPRVQGLSWVNNDVVNLLATLCGAVFAMTCFEAAFFAS